MDTDKPSRTLTRIETLREHFEKGKSFTEELMGENERLRLRLVKVESENTELQSKPDVGSSSTRLDEIELMRKRLESMETRFSEVEEENIDFATRYAEVQLQNDNLMNLYVASYQLHSSLDPDEVIAVIEEIILNLIGAEEYLVVLKENNRAELLIIAGEGPEGPTRGQRPTEIDSALARVLEAGEPSFGNGDGSEISSHLACTPLQVNGDVVGAISIGKLLDQKRDGLTAIDRELLSLLSDHAATALVSADLHSRTERKLRTVEGFIDLLSDDKKS